MNGPKKLMRRDQGAGRLDDRAHRPHVERQYLPGGVAVGGGVRVSQGPSGGALGSPVAGQLSIDVEGWRPTEGRLPVEIESELRI